MVKVAGALRLRLCWMLISVWLPLVLWSSLPGLLPGATIAAGLQLLAVLAFISIHASLSLGWRGTGILFLIGYVTGFATEALSIHTGVPFGWFTHLAPGPQPLGVPLYVPLIYAFLSWPAWCLASLIGRQHPTLSGGATRWLVPLLGALILTGYDLAYDPIGSAVKGMWTYRDPGGVFGVPVSNFVGWIVTAWIILAIFSLIEPRLTTRRSIVTQNRLYWMLPCILWGGLALQYPLLQLVAPAGEVIVGLRRFVVADIYEGATIFALLAIAPLALAAATRALSIKSGD